MKFLKKKRPINPIKSAINLYMVKASVFIENHIHLKALDFVGRCQQILTHLPDKLAGIFSNWQCPHSLRFLLPIFNKVTKEFINLQGCVTLKLSPPLSYCARQFYKFQYWLINSDQVRFNGGVAIFSYESKDARKTFLFVALVHAILFFLALSFSELNSKKIPDLMIELSGSPAASDGLSQSPGEQGLPNPVKDVPKTSSVTENVDTQLMKERELKRLEKNKELELERERRKEIERERQKQKEKERELNLERVKEQERDRQRARELEQERKRELERERQRIKDLEQEKKKEQDRAREQERQKQKEVQEQKQREKQLEQQQKQQKQKEKLPEPKKLERDGTLPPPPAPATPAAPSIPAPSAPASSPPPSSSATPSSSAAASAPLTSGGSSSSASGAGGSMSASISNAPASAPTLDAEPKALTQSNPKPAYPLLAFKMKIQGKVLLTVDVAENGSVNRVTIAESSGNESLDHSALDAVKSWKFTPARKNGVIVSQVIKVPITFSLKNR
ncbi:energy transducer TonB [Polynucleobacter sp. MWH-Spelu-300-X4]|uniref:energy transducer TonB n=1 Tax=Polynucleobacter sp. MWH-Spelu-300-X4 TaxID=2689109 RepID=UPI001BFDB1D6|nr:energy transducer TonB [Polynucleobacter sp. MWH-Spelu-300-X4]